MIYIVFAAADLSLFWTISGHYQRQKRTSAGANSTDTVNTSARIVQLVVLFYEKEKIEKS